MAFNLFSQNSIKFSQERKQQILIAVLIVVALLTALVSYLGFFRSSQPATYLTSSEVRERASLKNVIGKIDFDIDFLKKPSFQDLKVYGEWPLPIENQGRDNPFIPF